MFLSKLPFLLCVAGALSLPSPLDYAVKEVHKVPRSWSKVGDAPRSHLLTLQIGLRRSNEDVLENHLLEISDPGHSRFRQHLQLEDIVDLTQPSTETQGLVESWLLDNDIREYVWNGPARDWISVVVTIEEAERLLQTRYSTFHHAESSTSVYRTEEWSLPKHLHGHIDVVQPTTSFFVAAPKRSTAMTQITEGSRDMVERRAANDSLAKICRGAVRPECVRTLYGTIDYTPQVPGKNKIAITNYLNQSSHRGDITKFLKRHRPEAVAAANEFDIVIINDAANHQGPYNKSGSYYDINIEGDLDAEQVLSIAWPTPMTAYNTGGFAPDGENEPFLIWLNYMRGQKDLPQVISTSYGDDESTVPESYARRVCHGFAELGARGVSVLFSAGDTGIAGRNGSCPGGDFVAHFPASCPWVTAVGGTREVLPETALDYGGGGFSNYFPRPTYQQHVVDAYVQSLNGKYDGRYNKRGRAYPDVAAQGSGLAAVQAGEHIGVSGTSASTPIFAAVISLVNDALLAQSEPPLGFLNPWIYGGAYQALTDVMDNTTYGGCNTKGFPVQKGWDAVTGFGTPNFGKLVEAAFARSNYSTYLGRK